VTVVEVPPTGLGLVTHLDPSSRVLEERYEDIRRELAGLTYDRLALDLVPAKWERVKALLR
jgi:hypothetical protein